MKFLMSAMLLMGLLISCGEDQVSSDFKSSEVQAQQALLVGSWCNQFDGQETMTFGNDNSFTTNVCGVTGTYQILNDKDYQMSVSTSNGGESCTPTGIHNCTYEFKNNNNTIDLRCNIQGSYYVTTFNRGACQ
jgi:hypothetical protein